MEDRYLNFYHYVMECIDDKDLPPDIDRIGYDDKGNYITASCKCYEK